MHLELVQSFIKIFFSVLTFSKVLLVTPKYLLLTSVSKRFKQIETKITVGSDFSWTGFLINVMHGHHRGWRNLFQSGGAQVHVKKIIQNFCPLNWQL